MKRTKENEKETENGPLNILQEFNFKFMLKHNIKTIQKDILFIFLHLREKSDGFIKANKGHLREQHFSSCDKAEDDLEG